MMSCAHKWLNEHPITRENNITFIKETIVEYIKTAEMAQKRTHKEKEN